MEAEDYDAAKQLKQNIDSMRLSTDVRPLPGRPSPPLSGRGNASAAALRSPVHGWPLADSPSYSYHSTCSWRDGLMLKTCMKIKAC